MKSIHAHEASHRRSQTCSMSAPQPRRVRLKPWLLAQVSSGRYPGLQWLNADRHLFQIPWKHATRHLPTSEEENTIFKAWALETGKYLEGVDEPDPAKWKANLRCALNKSREFQLKYDGTKETPVQPFKIYEVCDSVGCTDAGDDDEEEEMPNLMELSINPRLSDPQPYNPFTARTEVNTFSLSSNDTLPQIIPMPLLPEAMHSNPPVACNLSQEDFHASGHIVDQGPYVGLQDLDSLPGSSVMETNAVGAVHTENNSQTQNCKYDLLSSVPLTDLDLRFLYRGRTAGSLTVSNSQGCRLYSGHLAPTPEQVDLFGPVHLYQVLFPGTDQIQNQKQRFYTTALLDVMDRGLILEIWQQDIYAIRLCQCKVFWSGPGISERAVPNPMEREKKIKVFSLNDFLQGLIMFQKGEADNPPPFEITFCFGEDWPDRKPKEKKLIIVQVVPVVARILTEMFSGELSWSIDSIRLQISNPDVKDQTVQQFKELQRLLQSQHAHGPWAPAGP
ncbi:interferon regulatory factor 5 isoform X1 [Eucyclogobius newberryi]|uniref:interferon regulatory factor 5 isoform X1 n=2 Tax=Eucyclogobius newberryi TaxID=166745 RepID=UPI003B5A965D